MPLYSPHGITLIRAYRDSVLYYESVAACVVDMANDACLPSYTTERLQRFVEKARAKARVLYVSIVVVCGGFELRNADGAWVGPDLGLFRSRAAASTWARANGYRIKAQRSN